MRRVFADTFYWIALTNPADPYHAMVLNCDAELADAGVVTTDEVLTEYLTFYASDPRLRVRAAGAVRRIQANEDILVLPHDCLLRPGCGCTRRVPIRGIA